MLFEFGAGVPGGGGVVDFIEAFKLSRVDLSGVRELAKKAGHNLASSTASVARAAIGADLVDADMKRAHERLAMLHAACGEYLVSVKQAIERARKTARLLRETGDGSLRSVADAVSPATRRQVQSAMAVDAKLARVWEHYAGQAEAALLAPAKAEISALMNEGEHLYSQYLALVNEIAAKQGKERLLGKATDAYTLQKSLQPLHERRMSEK